MCVYQISLSCRNQIAGVEYEDDLVVIYLMIADAGKQ